MTFVEVLKKQFETQKELYITPTIIVLSALPQTILTFSFACTQLNDWERHSLLASYLLSYAPQVLGFILYVLPSTSYKKELSETFIGKNSLKWILGKKKE
jgi:ABC-type tungstate transport system substrate-binding protein